VKGKWCAIGLSAFLAGFLQGGNGFSSYNVPGNNNQAFSKYSGTTPPTINLQQFNTSLGHVFAGMQLSLIIGLVLLIFILIIGFSLLIYWLGSRGQFMFLDNIVRNRGAIGWPWAVYARQAHSLFLFYIVIMALTFAVVLIFAGIVLLVCLPLFSQHRYPGGGEIAIFVILGLLYLLFCVIFGVIIFVFREMGIPLMFRNNLTARQAFMATLGLFQLHPGSVAVFVLLRIAIFLGVAVLSIIICCCTLCIGMLPYIGTVILLPVLVYVKCFTLDCLAQFGPQYDVWTVDVPPPGTVSPFIPPPQLG
jgi:hypothetical protein